MQATDASESTENLSKEELGRLVASRWTGENADKKSGEDAGKDNGHETNEELPEDTHEEYDNYVSDTDDDTENSDDTRKYDDNDIEEDVDETYKEDDHEDTSSSYKSDVDDEFDLSGLQVSFGKFLFVSLFRILISGHSLRKLDIPDLSKYNTRYHKSKQSLLVGEDTKNSSEYSAGC